MVHAHFNNIFFDGIDKLIFKIGANTYTKKIPNKTEFAKAFGLEDVMNFPVDKRSPVCKVEEVESKEGEKWSNWLFHVRHYNDEYSKLSIKKFLAITPQSCTYSFCKSSAI